MNSGFKSINRAASSILVLLTIGGCAVGPNFKRPAPPPPHSYVNGTPEATVATTNVDGGEAQRFVEGADIPGQWWELFHSEELNGLIKRSLTNNPNYKAAQEALVVAQENLKAQRGVFYPTITGSLAASRQRQSSFIAPTPNANVFEYNLFTPEVAVSYSPDVFGLNRRTVEASKAQEQNARFQMLATYLTLTANVAVAAIQEASLRGQIETTKRLVSISSNMIEIVRFQLAKGNASGFDVAAQEAQLAQMNATLPPLRKQLAQQRDLLAALAGDLPTELNGEAFGLSKLKLPAELPISLPLQLVEQRPDIRQAEETLHAASAQVGVSIANRLPNITLTANAGSTALSLDKLFNSGSGFWTIGGTLAQPIFEGGTLLHQERSAKAAFREAAQQYRGAVVTACQNVADTLAALQEDAAALQTASAAAAAAKTTLDLSQEQWRVGYGAYLPMLTAEQTYQQAELNLIQAQANRFADTAALFQALGGGWWNQPGLAGK